MQGLRTKLENYHLAKEKITLENIDSLMKLESKIAKCAKDITKVDKNKKGFNFTYEDPNAIKTNAYEQFAKNKLMLDAPK